MLARSGTLNRGSTLSARRYLRTVFLDRPVRREISRIEKWSRWRQRRMTLNNSMLITPFSPALIAGKRFQHGSNLDGKTSASRVNSQWKSTLAASVPRSMAV
ncbi:hypothetical protein ACMYR2_0585 [Nitrobacter sp. TKz-YC01]